MSAFAAEAVAAGGGVKPASALENAAITLGFEQELTLLSAGRAAARQLETENDSELCATGAIVVERPLAELAAGFTSLTLLRDGGMMTAGQRLSATPQLSDLAGLEVPEGELENLRKARLGASDVKLSSAEIEALRASAPSATLDVFKGALLARAAAWRSAGLAGLSTYNDKRQAVDQSRVVTALRASLAATKPDASYALADSFQFWSTEQYGSLKPLVALSHMDVYKRPGAVRIETTQLYASHYCEGLVTSIDLQSVPSFAGEATLVRITFRTQVDALGGMMGGLKRKVGRARIVEQLGQGLEQMRSAIASR